MFSPLVFAVSAFAVGILLGTCVEATLVGVVMAVSSASGLWLLSRTRRRSRVAWALLLVGIVALGIFRWELADRPAAVRPGPDPVRLRVNPERPGFSGERWEATILESPDFAALEGASIVVQSPAPPVVSTYWIEGVIEPPPPARNPGGFDYGAYLDRRGFTGILSATEMNPVGGPSIASQLATSMRHGLAEADLHPGAQGLVRALSLGDRRGFREGDEEAFRRAGIAHLLAVSGLHIAFLGMGVQKGLSPLIGSRASSLAAVVAVTAFSRLVGATPSAMRAALVFVLYAGGRILGIKPRAGGILALAALVLLLFDPRIIVEAGFQLSFAAASGIALACSRPGFRQRSRFHQLWIVSVAAWMATAPLSLWHFHRLAPAGLLLGPLLLPVFPGVLLLSWTNGVAALLGVSGSCLGSLAAPLGWVADAVAALGAMSPVIEARTNLGAPIFLGVSTVILLTGTEGGTRTRRSALLWVPVILLWLLALNTVWHPALPDPGGLRLIVFDVGQGDAILVETPCGGSYLVDAGPPWGDTTAAEHAVIPYLLDRGIRRLDHMLLTHGHLDHYGGIEILLEEFAVDTFWLGPTGEFVLPLEGWRDTRRALRGVREEMGDVAFHLHWPPPDPGSDWCLNERSAVLSVHYGRWSALLTGDLEGKGERALLRLVEPGELDAEFLKAGHHGSAAASREGFLDAVRPGVSAVSVGHNFYGLPDPRVMDRLVRFSELVFSTKESGAVIVETDGRRWRVVGMKGTPSHYEALAR